MVNANTRAFSSRYTLLPRATNERARARESESFGRTVSSRPPLPLSIPPYTLNRHRDRERTRFRISSIFSGRFAGGRSSCSQGPLYLSSKPYTFLLGSFVPRTIVQSHDCTRVRVYRRARPASTDSQLQSVHACQYQHPRNYRYLISLLFRRIFCQGCDIGIDGGKLVERAN